jgi:hypothetical protein
MAQRLDLTPEQQAESIAIRKDVDTALNARLYKRPTEDDSPTTDISLSADESITVPTGASKRIAEQTDHMKKSVTPKRYYGGIEALDDDEVVDALKFPMVSGVEGMGASGEGGIQDILKPITKNAFNAPKNITGFGVGDFKNWASSQMNRFKLQIPSNLMLQAANEIDESRGGAIPFSNEWFKNEAKLSLNPIDNALLAPSLLREGVKDIINRVDVDVDAPQVSPHGGPSRDVVAKRHYGIKVKEMRDKSKELIDKYQQAGVREGWLNPENRTMIHVFGDIGSSIAQFAGLTYMMGGNPSGAAAYFSLLTQSDSYVDAIQNKGMSHEEAVQLADVKALQTYAFTAVGGNILYKGFTAPSKSMAMQVAKGSFVEGVEEGGESLSHNITDILFGVGDKDWGEILLEGGQAAATGALGGGTFSGGAKLVQDSRLQGELLSPAFQEKSAASLAEGLAQSAERKGPIAEARAKFDEAQRMNAEAGFGPVDGEYNSQTDPILDMLDEVMDMLTAQSEIMEDSMIQDSMGGPKTAPGKETAKVRKEVSKLVDAFLKNEAIEPLMSTAQKEQIEKDTIKKMKEMTVTERRMGEEAVVRDFDKKIKGLGEKMSALEARGEEMITKEAGKPDLKRSDRLDGGVELNTKQAKKLADDFEALADEVRLAEEARDKIIERSGILDESINRLPADQETVGRQNIGEKLSRIVAIRSNAEIKAFKKGIKQEEKLNDTKAKNLFTLINNVIDTMPISKAGKAKIARKAQKIHTANDLETALDRISIGGLNVFREEQTKKAKKAVEKVIKENKSSKGKAKAGRNDPQLTHTLDMMNSLTTEEAKAVVADPDSKENMVEELQGGKYADVFMRYAKMKADGDKASLMDTAKLADDLEFMKQLGYLPTELSLRKQQQIAEALRAVDTGTLLSETEISNPENLAKVWSERYLEGTVNYLSTTYHTMLVRVGLGESEVFNMAQAEMNWRQALSEKSAEIREIMKDLEMTAKKDLSSWSDPKNNFKPASRTVGDVNTWLDNAEDLDTAKKIAKKYISNRDKGTNESIDKAETVEDLQAMLEAEGIISEGISQEMTKAEALLLYAQLRNSDTKASVMNPLGRAPLTQSKVDELDAFVGADSQEKIYVDGVIDLLSKVGDDLAPVYERVFGIPMPRHENYIQQKRSRKKDDESGIDPNDPFGVDSYMGDIRPGLTKKRSGSLDPLKAESILDVVENYTREAYWFIHTAEQFQAMNSVMGHSDFRNHMIQKIGKDGYDRFAAQTKMFETHGGVKESIPTPKGFKALQSRLLRFTLGFKPQIGLKQTSSTFAFMEDVPTEYFISKLASSPKNFARWRNELREHPAIKNRGEHFDHEWDAMRGNNKLGWYGEKSKIGEASIFFGRTGDITAIYMGGGIMFDYLVDVKGMSKEDAVSLVVQKTEESQQSSLRTHKTPLQADPSAIHKLLGMYKTSPIAQNNMIAKAHFRRQRGEITQQQFNKTLLIYHVIIPQLFTFIGTGLVLNEEEAISRLLIGNLDGTPYVGDAISMVSSKVLEETTGIKSKQYPIGTKNPLEELTTEAASTYKAIMSEEATEVEVLMAMADLFGFLSNTGVGTLGHMTEGAFGIGEFNETEDWMRLMGFSEGSIDNANKE